MGNSSGSQKWKEKVTERMSRQTHLMPTTNSYVTQITRQNNYKHTYDYLEKLFWRYGNYQSPKVDEKKIKRRIRRIVIGSYLIGRTSNEIDLIARYVDFQMRYEAALEAEEPVKSRANQYVEYYRKQKEAKRRINEEREREEER